MQKHRMKVLVNTLTAKKKAGGAFQISANFILETLKRPDVEWYYMVSTDLDHFIGKYFRHLLHTKYFVFKTQPDFLNTYRETQKKVCQLEEMLTPDIIYSVTAPSYFFFKTTEVMRFANAWVTNPNREAYSTLDYKSIIRNKFYFYIQKKLMRKCSYFITQTEVVKKGICRITGLDETSVCVIPNVLPAFFSQNGTEKYMLSELNYINVACVAAPFHHKNLLIIPDILRILRDDYNMPYVRFLITIPENDSFFKKFMQKIEQNGVRENVQNWGFCSQERLLELYQNSSACFIPSLLETFSASILEGLFFQLPIVATNFDFNTEVAGNAALYYIPKNAKSAADKLSELFSNSRLKDILKMNAKKQIEKYQSYEAHMDAIVNYLATVYNKNIIVNNL